MKIFLAGTFSEQKNAETIKQSKYLLESFYYIKPWQAELMQSAKEFVLDSGAFSFMQDERKGWFMLTEHTAIIFGLTEKEMGIIIKIVKSWQNQYYNKSQN